jgi:hypothetical protein
MTKRKEYPHAWVLREIADGAPLSDFEVNGGGSRGWEELDCADILRRPDAWEIRKKVKMHRIGEHTFPAPMAEAPEIGSQYWFAGVMGVAERMSWDGHNVDIRLLNAGLLHTTSEAAESHSKALAAIARGEPV